MSIIFRLAWVIALVCAGLTLVLQPGCQAISLPALLGTPTSAEKKIPAEYNLTEQKDKKILVLVDQPAYFATGINLRYFLTDMIIRMLQSNAKLGSEQFIDYDALAEFRANSDTFWLLTPEQVGSRLGAQLVLFVIVSDYQITLVGDTGLNNGLLEVQAAIVDVATGQRLWPTLEQAKVIQVSFESKRQDSEAAAVRLAVAAAHCVTRYFYNCRKDKFTISEERTGLGWEDYE